MKTAFPNKSPRNNNIGRNVIYEGAGIIRQPSIGIPVPPNTIMIPPNDEDVQLDTPDDSPDSTAGRTAAPTEASGADAEESRPLTRTEARRTGRKVQFEDIDWGAQPGQKPRAIKHGDVSQGRHNITNESAIDLQA